ncbi:zinc finger protein 711-like isoform X1 [Amphiura filiformis]|uniref:zinc finger protein 711-like isoform X1 n=1 Tax=Amphiura filiformis TaxID=82378 RepID=UPI003B224444
MASVLNFCDSCADKRVREVKTELEQLFKKKKLNRRKCGICCSELILKKESVEERIDHQQEFLPSANDEVIKTESIESVEEIAILPKDVSVSREDSDGNLEDTETMPSDVSDDDESDAGSNYSDEIEIKASKSRSAKRKGKTVSREDSDGNLEDTETMPSDVSDDDESDAGSNYSDEIEIKASKSRSAKRKGKTTEGPVKCRSKFEINDVNPEVKEMILEGSVTSKQFACKFCRKKFQWKAALMTNFSVHLSEHMEQKEELKPFKCPLCTLCFNRFSTLKKHTRAHPLYDCPHLDCDRKRKAKLGVAKEHKSFVCQICGVVLKYATSLENHLLRHKGLKAFKCSECDKCFIDKPSLTRHQVTHSDAKNVICEVCGKAFVLLDQLKNHRIVHSERAYQCEYCPYRAKRLRTLQDHTKRIHMESSLNKCTCNVCGLSFLSAAARTKHEKKHQDGLELAETLLKPYKCPDCGYRAKKPCYIRIHRRSHTGEKSFKCSHCQRAFTQRGQCTKHMKICKKRWETNVH